MYVTFENKAVETWYKRFIRRKEFFLHGAIATGSPEFTGQKSYYVIWVDHTASKVKFGRFTDGMYVRYGPDVFATLSGTEVTDLWMKSPGIIGPWALDSMLRIARGDYYLDRWDPSVLLNLKH